MNKRLVDILIEKKMSISFAESCTGGLLASTIVEVSNASKVFNESIVTYSNEAKIKYLGVKEETLKEFGAVSEEVAKEMAIGIAKAAKANIGVSITGIAGPLGGSVEKPVGLVCFGFCIENECYTKKVYFGDLGRNKVREESVKFAINYLIEIL